MAKAKPVIFEPKIICDTREQRKYAFRKVMSDESRECFPLVLSPDVIESYAETQKPYEFQGIMSDAKQGGGPLVITVEVKKLATGDYSIEGHEDKVCVERKSKVDLFGTLTSGRDRFERELIRMTKMQSPHIVCEAEWSEILNDPPKYSKTKPKSIYRSVLAWIQRYPMVHWHFVPGREVAEVWTFRILQRFQIEWVANQKKEEKT